MKERPTVERIVQELFVEQEHFALSIQYRHGWLRTAFVLLRSILFSRIERDRTAYSIRSGERVALVIFENERRAIARAPAALRVDRVIALEMKSLGIVRARLGTLGAARELLRFLVLVVRIKGFRYLPRSAHPALGWMLYKSFCSVLSDAENSTIVTTNMIHPTSIGIQWAAVASGKRSAFFEHATTPGIIMVDRGYDELHVNFEHTRRLMVSKGFDAARIHVLGSLDARARQRVETPLRNIAICVNSYDTMQSVQDMSDEVERLGARVTYRIHDADSRIKEITAEAERRGFALSFARRLPFQEFLEGMDLVLTGNSNVIADALLAGKAVVYYWAGQDDMFDYYGFVQTYEVPSARSAQSLRSVFATLIQIANTTGSPSR